MARRMMMFGMMNGGCGWEEPSAEDRIALLEEYQRDLEQEAHDVAEEIRRLREKQGRDTSVQV